MVPAGAQPPVISNLGAAVSYTENGSAFQTYSPGDTGMVQRLENAEIVQLSRARFVARRH